MSGRRGGGRLGVRGMLLGVRLLNVAALAGMVAVAGLICVVSLLTASGSVRLHEELTGSMAPTIRAGDLIVYRPVAAAELLPGDVISFSRGRGALTVTHRVLAVAPDRGTIVVSTKGDANATVDHEPAVFDPSQVVWRVRHVVPRVGVPLAAVTGGRGLPLLIGLAPLALTLPWLQRQLRADLERPGPG